MTDGQYGRWVGDTDQATT